MTLSVEHSELDFVLVRIAAYITLCVLTGAIQIVGVNIVRLSALAFALAFGLAGVTGVLIATGRMAHVANWLLETFPALGRIG